MADTWLDIVTDSLIEIGAYAPGDIIAAPAIDLATRWLNRTLDQWSALKRYAYNVNFTQYTLTPNHQPTLIGPGLTAPDFATPNGAVRPVRIESASLILTGSNPTTDLPINIRDDQWWADQQVKNLTSTIPTDLYYSPDFPNGALYFWPTGTVAYGIRLEMWVSLGQVSDVTTAFVAPPGYNAAVMLSLAENLVTPFSRQMPPALPDAARKARTAIQTDNMASPRIATADWGTGLGARSGFNWRTGQPS